MVSSSWLVRDFCLLSIGFAELTHISSSDPSSPSGDDCEGEGGGVVARGGDVGGGGGGGVMCRGAVRDGGGEGEGRDGACADGAGVEVTSGDTCFNGEASMGSSTGSELEAELGKLSGASGSLVLLLVERRSYKSGVFMPSVFSSSCNTLLPSCRTTT